MRTITVELLRRDARRASLRAAFSLFITLVGIGIFMIAAISGYDLIGW